MLLPLLGAKDILIVDNGSAFRKQVSAKLVVAELGTSQVLHSRQSFEPPRRVLAALRGKPLLGPALRAGASGGAATEKTALRESGIIGTGAMGKEHIRNVAPRLQKAKSKLCDVFQQLLSSSCLLKALYKHPPHEALMGEQMVVTAIADSSEARA